ncbi:MAG: SUMF1/EgtB/PvdO family nonheme iron enzyme, partial [Candidatus Latescibacteria bacterium]|nr:SUMF1/EgtB/PvdO family nonheme iron enzyme [Candidatus Latescibacterota bacterium]
YRPAFLGDDLPATNISWQEAQAYCQSVGKRLPTEAEWERACRGGQGYAYEYGMPYDDQMARTGMGLDLGPVEVHTLGDRGVVGLTGNVWEWCADWYDRDIYRKRLKGSFESPEKGDQHVLRGGAWYSNAQAARCTHRPGNVKKMRDPSFGFRCARDSE